MADSEGSAAARVRDREILDGTRVLGGGRKRSWWWLLSIAIVFAIWQFAAYSYDSVLLMPPPLDALAALWRAVRDPEILLNMGITIKRVLIGFSIAMLIGVPLGYLMGYSQRASAVIDPLINTLRQIPIMAWVPLSIVWFGLGDGPTIFIIAFVGVFAVILSTIAGVRSIPKDYYDAARSMGAGRLQILTNVILPATVPDIITGARLALGAGWGSVICAEFIATSAGFGYVMVRAQTQLETGTLMALMLMAALVGFTIDRGLIKLNHSLAKWRFAE
ncbi:MAG: ABC-type nitrate/sulfonate/bicarbonate transport system permease [Actinobacteria bacterium]|nr:MAG: ABC-type nitrate/sulfonate/bicarbonate transport system permease [Actinomycetota bacterium]MDO8950002.1 ABC transporter permease subunit SaoP [Actinomycetota bacterium]